MRFLIGIIGAVIVFIAVSFLPNVQNYFNDKAFEYLEQDELKKARLFYFPGKIGGNEKAINNYHVLNYRIYRYSERSSKRQRQASRKKAFRAFDKLTQKGYIPAAYNAGMFYYRHKAGSSGYKNGLMYLNYAAKQGDEMSRHAADMMRARQYQKDKRAMEYRKAADNGNGLAAYQYVKDLRFDKKKLRRAEKYALMGAEGGYADAQEFLTTYFPHRSDRKAWLEMAATNKHNRSLIAAYDLAMLAEKRRDYEMKRQWLTLGSTPRGDFKYHAIIDSEVLRWRGLQSTILGDFNNSKKAAYQLALMQIDGKGGPVDKEGAMKSLEYAGEWNGAELLLAELRAGGGSENQSTSVKPKSSVNLSLEKFDKNKNMPNYEKLRPLVKNKQIRYATHTDLQKFSLGASTTYSNKKRGFKHKGGIEKCSLSFNCFYMEKAIILPGDMYGAHSATFLINPAIFLPEQSGSHNKYIFLSKSYIP